MLTRENVNIADMTATENFFADKMQLDSDKVSIEVSIAGTDAPIKAYLKVSLSGKNFVIPHEDAVVEIVDGTKTVVVPFSGLTVGSFVEFWIYKQAATTGVVSAIMI